ncbi:MAG: DPP IV N-terminal domain-containing protein [Saprospiraceae bacterium]|nr:DPP IV N-terminal domain-containing protein [Saprospiraceae bacterium]
MQHLRSTINPILTIILLACGPFIRGQDQMTREDYQRAINYLPENLINKKVFNVSLDPHWLADSSGFWYIHYGPGIKTYRLVSFPDMTPSDLFDHQRLAHQLNAYFRDSLSPVDLPIQRLEVQDNEELWLTVKGKTLVLNLSGYELSEKSGPSPPDAEHLSPDGKWVAFGQDFNLFVRSIETGEEKQLSFDGCKGYEYATWYGWGDIMEGENGERPSHFGVNWSNDGAWIMANLCDLRQAQKMYLLDWSVDSLYRPRLLSYYRGSPGDTTMIYEEPVFIHVPSGKIIRTGLPRSTYINAIDARWSTSPGKVWLQQTSRGYQTETIYLFDLNTQVLDTIYQEISPTNIDHFRTEMAERSNRLFYLSEKSGWSQLYTLDLVSRKEKHLAAGNYYVENVVRVDEVNQWIYFTASGKDPGSNPYYTKLYRIQFDGNDLRCLTPEDLNHRIELSPDGLYLVDNMSTVQTPTRSVVRNTKNGAIISEIGHATFDGLSEWSPPEIFTTLARDRKTTIYGTLWKPTNFDPAKKYPVLEYVYTGPHTHVFPTEYSRAFGFQNYAELGFIVLVVDGLGSSGRSKAFHNYSYKNLGGNLADHVLAIRSLGEKYTWFDTTRVGIFGHSAGGYDAAHALLAYPETYKVGVASSGDHDHRMEKAWWPEMYMGWPVDSAYEKQSNVTLASHLQGKLLLVHGGIDENVNPSATFKLAEALIKSDKPFDMLILPSQHHGYQGIHSNYFRKVRWNYFLENLRGVQPLWNIEN